MLIGLTGGIGCGKSTVLAIFAELGCPVFSADAEVAALLEEPSVRDALHENFGLTVFKDGQLDKGALAGMVFGGPGPLKRLEAILHPRVLARLEVFGAAHAADLAVAEIPLLFEKKLEGLFAATVCVFCPEAVAFQRYARARSVSLEEVYRRAARQMPLETKKQWADHLIDTGRDPDEVRAQVDALLQELKTRLCRTAVDS